MPATCTTVDENPLCRDRRQWIVFKLGPPQANGKWDKFPFDPKTGEPAKVNGAETWGMYDEAARAYLLRGGLDGTGYGFTENDPYAGTDLDECRDPLIGVSC